MSKKYGMVIDLHQCVGCGACALGCKIENNTEARRDGQSFNWADFIMKTEGTFPNTRYVQMPVLCNHCDDAPCVMACPVTPKAMFKADDGTTLHNQDRCIGCRQCQDACPYSQYVLDGKSNRGEEYSVISFNAHGVQPQSAWYDKQQMIPGCTASGAEVAKRAGAIPPDMNKYQSGDYQPVRADGVVEKCIFCHHKVINGEQPACVEACPANARIFGDQNDPNSEISKVKAANRKTIRRHKEDEGTEPNIFYIRSYNDPDV
jgi:Fe-S-cluster-containing dehydrogenase component